MKSILGLCTRLVIDKLFLLADSKYFILVGHIISVTATQFCHCSAKAATDKTEINERGCVPTKPYLPNRRRVGFGTGARVCWPLL